MSKWNVTARSAAEQREQMSRTPEWKKPPVKWHRVRLIDGSRAFFYLDRTGAMCPAAPGDEVEIDSETLEMRRRDVRVL